MMTRNMMKVYIETLEKENGYLKEEIKIHEAHTERIENLNSENFKLSNRLLDEVNDLYDELLKRNEDSKFILVQGYLKLIHPDIWKEVESYCNEICSINPN